MVCFQFGKKIFDYFDYLEKIVLFKEFIFGIQEGRLLDAFGFSLPGVLHLQPIIASPIYEGRFLFYHPSYPEQEKKCSK